MKKRLKNIFKFGIAISISAYFFVGTTNAENTGSITGIVIDSETKDPLQSVNVLLEGTGNGAATLADGTFRFGDVPTGKYSLSASMIGYEKGYSLDVNVEPGKSINVEFYLKESFFQMNQVVVTATRTNRIFANVPISTEVISYQEIVESGARDISELLEDRAGVLAEPGVAGGKHINLLGSDSKYVLVMIDGEPITGKFNDRVELDDLVISAVERIEIVKGPASSLYGSEAMSGVINIITREPNENLEINGKIRGASNDGKEFDLGISSKKNDFSYLLQGNLYFSGTDKNDPFLQIDNFFKKSFTGKAKYAFTPKSKISFKTEFFNNKEEGKDVYLNNQTDVNRYVGEVKYELPYRAWANFDMKYRNSYYQRVFSRFSAANGALTRSDTTTQRYYEIETNYIREADDFFKFNFGYEYSSDNLVTPRLEGDHDFTIKHQHIYAQAESELSNDFIFTAGLRYDKNSNVKDYTSPRAGFLYNISDEFKIRGSWGKGFRLPSLINLFFEYYNDAVGYSVIGNPDLLPEKSTGINIGLEYYLFRKSLFTLNIFQNDFEDMITDTTVSPGVFSYINVESTTLKGIEAQSKIFVSVNFTAQLSYNYLDAVNNRNGNYLPNRARHSGSLKTTFRTTDGKLRATLRANYIGERNQREYDIKQQIFLPEIRVAEPYFTLDLNSNRKISKHLAIIGGINNLLDTTDFKFGPWIGRNIYLELVTSW